MIWLYIKKKLKKKMYLNIYNVVFFTLNKMIIETNIDRKDIRKIRDRKKNNIGQDAINLGDWYVTAKWLRSLVTSIRSPGRSHGRMSAVDAMVHLLAGDDHLDGWRGSTATGWLMAIVTSARRRCASAEDEIVVMTTTSTVTKNIERPKTAILALAESAATRSMTWPEGLLLDEKWRKSVHRTAKRRGPDG